MATKPGFIMKRSRHFSIKCYKSSYLMRVWERSFLIRHRSAHFLTIQMAKPKVSSAPPPPPPFPPAFLNSVCSFIIAVSIDKKCEFGTSCQSNETDEHKHCSFRRCCHQQNIHAALMWNRFCFISKCKENERRNMAVALTTNVWRWLRALNDKYYNCWNM